MIENVLGGMIAFVGLAAVVMFKYAAITTNSPSKDESLRIAFIRLGKAYIRCIRRTLESAWFWAVAGAWTAFLVAYGFFFPV